MTLTRLSITVLILLLNSCSKPTINAGEPTAIATNSNSDAHAIENYNCPAFQSWVIEPSNPPNEIPKGKNAQLCQFYQFSWQWFISLMAEQPNGQRTYENQVSYPMLIKNFDSCLVRNSKRNFFLRVKKDNDDSDNDFILPEDIHQAGSNATIYDQNGNVVYYEVRFDRGMCDVPASAKMFPAGTTELKLSWRVISEQDKADYVWINADIDNNGVIEASELLGLVGFHFVRSTTLHPEFVWATFEHKKNAPDCQSKVEDNNDWSFASAACATQLPNSVNPTTCPFNVAQKEVALKSKPTEICQVYHAGTAPNDNQAAKNLGNIDTINHALTGSNGFITQLPTSNPLQVLSNYKIVGALWENDVTQPSTVKSNQRGSIQLANTTMETTEQQGFSEPPYVGTSNLKPAANCFDCHGYTPGNNITLSHIFTEIHGTNNTDKKQ